MESLQSTPQSDNVCPILNILKAVLFVVVSVFLLYIPLGDPQVHCETSASAQNRRIVLSFFCEAYKVAITIGNQLVEVLKCIACILLDLLYEAKLGFYALLEKIDQHDLCTSVCCNSMTHGIELAKEEVDKVIEDEITQKLSTDLLQSIERKFQVDLERSVDMVLLKIKLILQNGSHHIQDKLVEIQGMLEVMKKSHEKEVVECLTKKENATSMLAERALHQMVVCGYALIGQDPALAVSNVVKLKNMIKEGVKPIYEQKQEIYGLLKVCGHLHDALRKVVQCVISKSPLIKSVMMDVTGKLIEGVVELTKLMAHGAMHEACLIEVVKSVEDDAVELIIDVRNCAYGNESYVKDLDEFIAENNATVLNIINKKPKLKELSNINGSNIDEMQDILRRMLGKDNTEDLDKKFKENLITLQTDVYGVNNNIIGKDVKNKEE